MATLETGHIVITSILKTKYPQKTLFVKGPNFSFAQKLYIFDILEDVAETAAIYPSEDFMAVIYISNQSEALTIRTSK